MQTAGGFRPLELIGEERFRELAGIIGDPRWTTGYDPGWSTHEVKAIFRIAESHLPDLNRRPAVYEAAGAPEQTAAESDARDVAHGGADRYGTEGGDDGEA